MANLNRTVTSTQKLNLDRALKGMGKTGTAPAVPGLPGVPQVPGGIDLRGALGTMGRPTVTPQGIQLGGALGAMGIQPPPQSTAITPGLMGYPENIWSGGFIQDLGDFLSIPQYMMMQALTGEPLSLHGPRNAPSDWINKNVWGSDPSDSSAAMAGRFVANLTADVILDPLNLLAVPLKGATLGARAIEGVAYGLGRTGQVIPGVEKALTTAYNSPLVRMLEGWGFAVSPRAKHYAGVISPTVRRAMELDESIQNEVKGFIKRHRKDMREGPYDEWISKLTDAGAAYRSEFVERYQEVVDQLYHTRTLVRDRRIRPEVKKAAYAKYRAMRESLPRFEDLQAAIDIERNDLLQEAATLTDETGRKLLDVDKLNRMAGEFWDMDRTLSRHVQDMGFFGGDRIMGNVMRKAWDGGHLRRIYALQGRPDLVRKYMENIPQEDVDYVADLLRRQAGGDTSLMRPSAGLIDSWQIPGTPPPGSYGDGILLFSAPYTERAQFYSDLRKGFQQAYDLTDEQADAGMTMLHLHARHWASKKNGRNFRQWFNKVHQIWKNGELTSPDQLFDIVDQNGDVFYSKVRRALENPPPQAMTPDQWRNWWKGKASADELYWTGVDDALEGWTGQSVTPDMMIRAVEERAFRVDEVIGVPKPNLQGLAIARDAWEPKHYTHGFRSLEIRPDAIPVLEGLAYNGVKPFIDAMMDTEPALRGSFVRNGLTEMNSVLAGLESGIHYIAGGGPQPTEGMLSLIRTPATGALESLMTVMPQLVRQIARNKAIDGGRYAGGLEEIERLAYALVDQLDAAVLPPEQSGALSGFMRILAQEAAEDADLSQQWRFYSQFHAMRATAEHLLATPNFRGYVTGMVPRGYREFVMTAPEVVRNPIVTQALERNVYPESDYVTFLRNMWEDYGAQQAGSASIRVEDPALTSSADALTHWWRTAKLPSVIHARTTDRVLPDGRKILFVEEIQGDIQQKLARHGQYDREAVVGVRQAILRAMDDDDADIERLTRIQREAIQALREQGEEYLGKDAAEARDLALALASADTQEYYHGEALEALISKHLYRDTGPEVLDDLARVNARMEVHPEWIGIRGWKSGDERVSNVHEAMQTILEDILQRAGRFDEYVALRGQVSQRQEDVWRAVTTLDLDPKKAENHVIPDAPFINTFSEVMLRRLVRYAASEGYDGIGITPAIFPGRLWDKDVPADFIRVRVQIGEGSFGVPHTVEKTAQAPGMPPHTVTRELPPSTYLSLVPRYVVEAISIKDFKPDEAWPMMLRYVPADEWGSMTPVLNRIHQTLGNEGLTAQVIRRLRGEPVYDPRLAPEDTAQLASLLDQLIDDPQFLARKVHTPDTNAYHPEAFEEERGLKKLLGPDAFDRVGSDVDEILRGFGVEGKLYQPDLPFELRNHFVTAGVKSTPWREGPFRIGYSAFGEQYDKKLPAQLEKIGKRFGAQLEYPRSSGEMLTPRTYRIPNLAPQTIDEWMRADLSAPEALDLREILNDYARQAGLTPEQAKGPLLRELHNAQLGYNATWPHTLSTEGGRIPYLTFTLDEGGLAGPKVASRELVEALRQTPEEYRDIYSPVLPITDALRKGVTSEPFSLFQRDGMSRAQTRAFIESMSMPDSATIMEILGDKPEYLDAVVEFMVKQKRKAVAGQFTAVDYAKAYLLTLSSIRAAPITPEALARSFPEMAQDASIFSHAINNGRTVVKLRLEDVAARWMASPEGRRAVDLFARGDPSALHAGITRVRRAFGAPEIVARAFRTHEKDVVTLAQGWDEWVAEANRILVSGADDVTEALGPHLMRLSGIGVGKEPFLRHLLGFGNAVTLDSNEMRWWLTNSGDTAKLGQSIRQVMKRVSDDPESAMIMRNRISQAFQGLRHKYGDFGLDPDVYDSIMHHWFFDRIQNLRTTHASFRDVFSQMAQKGKQVRGSIEFIEDGKAIFRAFKEPKFSTFVHELAHLWRRDLTDADLDIAEKWAGVANGVWHREAEEKFARGFEAYLRDGHTPVPELRTVFEKVKQWMLEIYRSIIGTPLDVDMSPEIRGVFSRMLGSDLPPQYLKGVPGMPVGRARAGAARATTVAREVTGGAPAAPATPGEIAPAPAQAPPSPLMQRELGALDRPLHVLMNQSGVMWHDIEGAVGRPLDMYKPLDRGLAYRFLKEQRLTSGELTPDEADEILFAIMRQRPEITKAELRRYSQERMPEIDFEQSLDRLTAEGRIERKGKTIRTRQIPESDQKELWETMGEPTDWQELARERIREEAESYAERMESKAHTEQVRGGIRYNAMTEGRLELDPVLARILHPIESAMERLKVQGMETGQTRAYWGLYSNLGSYQDAPPALRRAWAQALEEWQPGMEMIPMDDSWGMLAGKYVQADLHASLMRLPPFMRKPLGIASREGGPDTMMVGAVQRGDGDLVSDPSWGPLAGKSLPRYVYSRITQLTRDDPAPVSLLQPPLGWWKRMFSTRNPAVVTGNIVGNFILAHSVGGVGPWHLPDYWQALKELLTGEGPYLKLAPSHLLSTYTGVELRASRDEYRRFVQGGGSWKQFLQTMGWLGDRMDNFYQFSEQLFKHAVFIREVRRQTGQFASTGRLTVSEAVKSAAEELAQKALFDYRDVPYAVDLLRRSGLIPFATFPIKALPVMAEAVAKYPYRVNLYVRKIPHGFESVDPDYKRKREEESALLPDWIREGPYVRLPHGDVGAGKYLGIGRVFPFQAVEEFVGAEKLPGGLPQELARGVASFLGPPIKMPIEILSGKRAFGTMPPIAYPGEDPLKATTRYTMQQLAPPFAPFAGKSAELLRKSIAHPDQSTMTPQEALIAVATGFRTHSVGRIPRPPGQGKETLR